MMFSVPPGGPLFAYSALFFCIAVGLLVVRRPKRGTVGPGYWAIAYLLIGCGLLLWSLARTLPSAAIQVAIVTAELAGPFLLGWGAYRFAGLRFRRWNLVTLAGLALAWATIAVLILVGNAGAMIGYTVLRALLVFVSGIVFLRSPGAPRLRGAQIAGWGLILSALFIGGSAAAGPSSPVGSTLGGWTIGLSALSAFGMALVSNGTRSESAPRPQFSRIVPVCSYCKRVRDENGHWQEMSDYLESEIGIDFSHGICPECAEIHYPQFGLYRKSE